jgi:MFS family permease
MTPSFETELLNVPACAKSGDSQLTDERRGRKAALASLVGGALEYYDFYIYATAASLVFGKIFFDGTGVLATLSSLATFGVAYLARPFGALILGHLGDRIGRRSILILTVSLMGTCTFLIGALPTYDQVGIIAPILLVVLRVGQGISAGAETAGASSITIEHAPVGRRGYFASFSTVGLSAGFVLASLSFLPVVAMDEAAQLSWGWRIPFLLSAVLMIIGFFVRRQLAEPEVFKGIKNERATATVPVAEVLRRQPADFIRVVLMSLVFTLNTLVPVFGLSYATNTVGLDSGAMLWVTISANALAVVCLPLAGRISDRIGRRTVYAVGGFGCAASTFIYFSAISTGNYVLVFCAGILLTGVFYSGCAGVYTSYFPELFSVKTRFTGMALGLQVGLVFSGFAPTIATGMVGEDPANWMPAAVLGAGLAALAGLTALLTRETAHVPLTDLGRADRTA